MILEAEHVSITFYASFNPIIKRWNVDTSTTCIDYHMLLFFTSGSFFTISLWILDLPILYLRPADLETEAQILCGLESIPLKINMEPKMKVWKGYFHLFSFSNRWFSGSMLIFQGVEGFCWRRLVVMFTSDWIARIHKNEPVDGCSE